MSKRIKLTPELLAEIYQDFDSTIQEAKITDGKISFTKILSCIDRKAIVYFTEIAWLKMQTLIREFDKEVAWHGVAYRGDDETKDEYFITDILVYPQEVTGATVNTDQEKYEMWLMMHDDDVFNNIRMQGHSHVNMGTTPSSVDITHQEKILAQLEDDMFYIFMIWNKRGDKTIRIYDFSKNIFFDTSDIKVEIQDDTTGISAFIKQAKEMVQDKKWTTTQSTKTNYPNKGNDISKTQSFTTNASGSEKKRKGKRKRGHKVVHSNACSECQLTLFKDNTYEDNYYDNFCGDINPY